MNTKKLSSKILSSYNDSCIVEARIMRKFLGDWYFIVPGSDDTFSYMEGIYTHRLTPDYPIEMGKRSMKPGAGSLFPYLSSNGSALSAGGHSHERCVLNAVSVKLADFIKRSAKQGRVRYIPECDALSIESEEELLSISLSVGIKDWLRKKENRQARVCRILLRRFLKKCIDASKAKIIIFKHSIKIVADLPKSALYFYILTL